MTIWGILKEQQSECEAASIHEFLEFVFHYDALEFYLRVLPAHLKQVMNQFHKKLAYEIFDWGNKYWLIMRSIFNHFMYLFA